MARIARIIIPEDSHHISQKANPRQDWGFCDEDYSEYLNMFGAGYAEGDIVPPKWHSMKFIFYRETFNSSREKDFGKSTGMMMAMGSPRWMVIRSASSRKRTLETKAS